jgi:dihydrofolate reductase
LGRSPDGPPCRLGPAGTTANGESLPDALGESWGKVSVRKLRLRAVHNSDRLQACDAVLMGRRTYEGFAPVWPTRRGDPASDRMNAMPKYVVSTTLKDPEWANTTVIAADVPKAISKLKAEAGKDIVQYGFGAVSTLLIQHGLLDELRLWIHPLFVGKGGPEDVLFPKGPETQFELRDVTRLNSGMLIASYELA